MLSVALTLPTHIQPEAGFWAMLLARMLGLWRLNQRRAGRRGQRRGQRLHDGLTSFSRHRRTHPHGWNTRMRKNPFKRRLCCNPERVGRIKALGSDKK
jgi:hypothetical protein